MSCKSCSEDGVEASAADPSQVICDRPQGVDQASAVSPVSTPMQYTRSSCSPKKADCCSPSQIPVQPYYNTVSVCREDNTQRIIQQLVGVPYKTRAPFAMPKCNSSIKVYFEPVADVVIGASLWTASYGYLTIVSFDPEQNMIELRNDCPVLTCPGHEQAAPGTPIPACTVFVIGPAVCGSCGSSLLNTPYLNAGFTAPEDGDCINITVTNIIGLAVDQTIGILSGVYRISAIVSPTIITICNDGSGLPSGTVVEYKDCSGNLLVPLVPINNNSCLADTTTNGILLVCDNNVTRPLTGLAVGQIPVITDASDSTVQFKTLSIPTLICTDLTSALTIDPVNPVGTTYLTFVADSSDFTVGDIVQISGINFEITLIPSATRLRLLPLIDPPAMAQTFSIGSAVCTADCCTQLELRLEELEDRVFDNQNADCNNGWLWQTANLNQAAAIVTDNITGGQTATGNVATVTLDNDSCFTMDVHYTLDWDFVFNLNGTDDQVCQITANTFGIADEDPLEPIAPIHVFPQTYIFREVPGGTAGVNRQSFHASYSSTFPVPAESSVTIKARCDLVYSFGDVTSIDALFLESRASGIGAAVKA